MLNSNVFEIVVLKADGGFSVEQVEDPRDILSGDKNVIRCEDGTYMMDEKQFHSYVDAIEISKNTDPSEWWWL